MGKIIFFLIFWWFILKKRLDRFQWNFQGLLTSLNPRRVQNFMTNRAYLHVEINTWKSRFSQITIFLYSGRWQTYFSKLEEWFRCNFQHSVLVLIPCKIHFGCRRPFGPTVADRFSVAAGACQRPDFSQKQLKIIWVSAATFLYAFSCS